MAAGATEAGWPALPYGEWRDAKETLHMFTQVLGKLRLALSPVEPEWQHVALYVTTSGLTTGLVPADDRAFEASLDLLDHRFRARTNLGDAVTFPLGGRSVAQFYEDVLEALGHLGVVVEINPKPQEVPDPVPFPEDERAGYDPVWVARYHRALTAAEVVLQRFRGPFFGRHTRVQFFWGAFDLNYTRFSGRPASPPPGAGVISIPGADAEQFSCGFWPGDDRWPEPAFFSYAYPRPDGFKDAAVEPGGWNEAVGEFLFSYEAARLADRPGEAVATFLQSSFAAASELGSWPDLRDDRPPPP